MLTITPKQSKMGITVEATDFLFCNQKPFSMREEIPFLQLFAERGLFNLEVDMPKGKYKGCHLSPKTEFKKGHIPWHKGKTGEKHPSWKGGRYEHGNGYICILHPNHPFATKGGYVFEHRLIMEKYLGRYLTSEEIVHHRGIKYPIGSIKNKQDNRIENLRLFANKSEHQKFHRFQSKK